MLHGVLRSDTHSYMNRVSYGIDMAHDAQKRPLLSFSSSKNYCCWMSICSGNVHQPPGIIDKTLIMKLKHVIQRNTGGV